MPEGTDWDAYARKLLQQREGRAGTAVLDLRLEATQDEWLDAYLVQLGAEELIRRAASPGSVP